MFGFVKEDDQKDKLLVRINENKVHKELSTSLAYTKRATTVLIISNSWKVSLTRTPPAAGAEQKVSHPFWGQLQY